MSWDKQWEDIHQINEWGIFPCEHLVREISRLYKQRKRKLNIIELGCGAGANMQLYNSYCNNFIGIDNSYTALKKCKNISKEFKDCKFTFFQEDITKIDFSQFKLNFDMVVDVECLYCLDNLNAKKVITSVSNYLKKDGKFFSLIFNEETDKKLLRNINGMVLRRDSDIKEIFSCFKKINIEKAIRTFNNRTQLISEFIVTSESFNLK